MMTSPVTPPEAIASNKDDKTLEVGNLYRSNDNTVSAGVSTSAILNIFSLGASTNSSQSNGLLTSSAISVSSTSTNVASGSSTGPIFSSSPAANIGSNIPSISATFPTSAPSIFGSGFSSSSPSTTFSFGALTAAGSTPPAFGSSLGASSGSSMFSFTSAAGMPNPVGFGSASPGYDQMNVEDSMAEGTVQASTPAAAPAFGQLANTSSSSNFVFGSAAMPAGGSSVFQFGSHQNTSTPQSPSPFTAPVNLEFPSGGSFSLGTGGVDKSNRKFVRARRDKHQKN